MFKLIAGPCVLESIDHATSMANRLKEICHDLDLDFYYKSSFDKANRTKLDHFRGFNIFEAVDIFNVLKKETGVKIITDFHEPWQASVLRYSVDMLQIPAFLCRQTDLLVAAAKAGPIINIKKGQFASARDTKRMLGKIAETNPDCEVWLTERGSSFGYDNLVVDMRNLIIMKEYAPVVLDATHAIQMGAAGGSRGATKEFIAPLARAGVAVGIDAIFLEVHDNPDIAPSDGNSMLNIEDLKPLLTDLVNIHKVVYENNNPT